MNFLVFFSDHQHAELLAGVDQLNMLIPHDRASVIDVLATPVLIGTLVWLSVFDWRHLRLPNAGTVPLICVGITLAVWRDAAIPWDAVLGALLGYGTFALVGTVHFQMRGVEGLGQGDAKLLAAAGAWLGWQALPGIVLLASVAGIVLALYFRKRHLEQIAFGPAIAAAFATHWLVYIAWSL